MLQPETFNFLNQLRANNNKEWFDQNRKLYDTAKADVLQLLNPLLTGLEQIDPAIAASQLKVKSCIFRINRDIRFSTDKSPYKTNFGAWFNVGGKKSPSAGYYFNIEPNGSFVADGMYMPDSKVLATIRQEIDYNLTIFEEMLCTPSFDAYFEDLSRAEALIRPPKGYQADNPAIEYLKLKSFTASHPLPDGLLTSPELAETVVKAFAGLQPLVAFLNRALGDEVSPP